MKKGNERRREAGEGREGATEGGEMGGGGGGNKWNYFNVGMGFYKLLYQRNTISPLPTLQTASNVITFLIMATGLEGHYDPTIDIRYSGSDAAVKQAKQQVLQTQTELYSLR
jgi:hypothetical protein